MQQGQKPGATNKKILVFVALAGLVFLGFVATLTFLALSAASELERTYYPECENLADRVECKRCCRERGHRGQARGKLANHGGRVCGCI